MGIKTSHHAVWTFIRREGLSYKKSLYADEQKRKVVQRKRKRWEKLKSYLGSKRLVFIDETWIKTNMAPL